MFYFQTNTNLCARESQSVVSNMTEQVKKEPKIIIKRIPVWKRVPVWKNYELKIKNDA